MEKICIKASMWEISSFTPPKVSREKCGNTKNIRTSGQGIFHKLEVPQDFLKSHCGTILGWGKFNHRSLQRSGAPHVLQRRQGTCPIPVGDKTRRNQKRSQGRTLAGVGNEAVCDCRDVCTLGVTFEGKGEGCMWLSTRLQRGKRVERKEGRRTCRKRGGSQKDISCCLERGNTSQGWGLEGRDDMPGTGWECHVAVDKRGTEWELCFPCGWVFQSGQCFVTSLGCSSPLTEVLLESLAVLTAIRSYICC